MILKGLTRTGLSILFNPYWWKVPALYQCPYFFFKFYPISHLITFFQKSYPFAVVHLYLMGTKNYFNAPNIDINKQPSKKVVLPLAKANGSFNPHDKSVIRSKSRSYMDAKIVDFLLEKAMILNPEEIKAKSVYEKKKILESSSSENLPPKYHGVLVVRHTCYPSHLIRDKYDRYVRSAFEALDGVTSIPSKNGLTYKLERGRPFLEVNFQEMIKTLKKVFSGLKSQTPSEDFLVVRDLEVLRENTARNPYVSRYLSGEPIRKLHKGSSKTD